jgi:twinkle protein
VEGEIDALSVHEAGIKAVVSVPNGASSGDKQKLAYLDNCIECFEEIDLIVIATDADAPGCKIRDELARRFGPHRCKQVVYPENCKDLNDVLLKFGPEKIIETIEEARNFPVEGVMDWDDIDLQLDELMENGFPEAAKIGFTEFDKLFSFLLGEISAFTGIPNSGKSEFVNQIIERLALLYGWRTLMISFESRPTALHVSRLCSAFIGEPFFGSRKMSKEKVDLAKKFYRDHVTFVNLEEIDTSVEGILKIALAAVVSLGIKVLVIDPWNWIETKRDKSETETEYVGRVLTELKRFALKYKVHIIIVAHPTKMAKDKKTGKYEIPGPYNISGSSNWFNKPDNNLTVHRDEDTNQVDVYVQKVKLFHVGRKGFATFNYDRETSRYAQAGEGFSQDYLKYYNMGDHNIEHHDSYTEYNPRIEPREEVDEEPPF